MLLETVVTAESLTQNWHEDVASFCKSTKDKWCNKLPYTTLMKLATRWKGEITSSMELGAKLVATNEVA